MKGLLLDGALNIEANTFKRIWKLASYSRENKINQKENDPSITNLYRSNDPLNRWRALELTMLSLGYETK